MRNKLRQFFKRLIFWNKSKKDFKLSLETEFKTSDEHTSENHLSWKDGEKTPEDNCTHVWVETNKRVKKPKMIYEEAYGPIPKGYVIYHKDGNKRNNNLDNLEAISRAELMKRNTIAARAKKKGLS